MVIHGNYEWDEDKAIKNAHDHGVTFEEAVEVFDDPYALLRYDEVHSSAYEDRYILTGLLAEAIVVCVVHTMRGERTRIISAREATVQEVEEYFDQRRID